MSDEVSGRTHNNGRSIRIYRDIENDREIFYADLGPEVNVVGRHATEAAAQAEADEIMTNAGHACSDACTSWEAKVN